MILINVIISFGIGYLVIKTAVKNAIIEAYKELNQLATAETIEK